MTVTEIRYGAGSVNHDRVRAAMAAVGDQLEAQRRRRVAVDHAETVARGGSICQGVDSRTGQPCEWQAVIEYAGLALCTSPGCTHPATGTTTATSTSRYGPHQPGDEPTSVEVWRRRVPPYPRELLSAIAPPILQQRRRINEHAHRNTQPTQEEAP